MNISIDLKNFRHFAAFALIAGLAAFSFSQSTPPAPGKPRTVNVPAVKESKLKNGLTVAVVERRSTPDRPSRR